MRQDIYGTLESATIDILKRYNREHLLEGTISLSAMFYKVANKLLSFYSQDELEEVLMDAWTHIFLVNGEKTIRMFTGRHPQTGETVHITSYLTMLMRNSIINHSKKNTARFLNEEGVTPIEQENHEEAYMRTIPTSHRGKASIIDTDYCEYLESLINDTRKTLSQLIDKHSNPRTIRKQEAKLDKLKKELDEVQGNIAYKPSEDWDAVYETNDTEHDELEFDSLLRRVAKTLTAYEEAVLAAMLGGMSNKEIQLVLDDIDVNQTITTIQNKIIDLAEIDEFEHDDNSMITAISQLTPRPRNTREKPVKSEALRSFRKCVSQFCSKKTAAYIEDEIYLNVKDFNQVVCS